MFGQYCSRLLVAALAIVTPAAMLHAALPAEPEVSGRTSFAGQLLIASPSLRDPFDHAVIMIARHDRTGALGIVINRPITRRPIATVLAALGVAWLANKLGQHGVALDVGHLVLAGSFTRVVHARKGDTLHADFGSLGGIAVQFV